MSDTLQEREDQMGKHQVTKSGTCAIPGCPCRGWSAQETATENTLAGWADLIMKPASEHQPAARGGGDEWRVVQRYDGIVLIVRAESDNRETPLLTLSKSDDDYVMADRIVTEHNQHQSLVAERERLERMLAAVVNAHYGLAYRSIGSGDGIPEKEAAEIGRWWLDYTASDA